MTSLSRLPPLWRPPPGWARWTPLILLVLAQLLTLDGRDLGRDQRNLLHAGRVLADGGTLYVDFVDTNFPAIMELSGLCVRAGGLLGVSPVSLLVLLCLAWCLLCAWAAGRALEERGMGETGVALFVTACYGFFTGWPYFETFAQREVFVTAAMVPALLYAGPPRRGDRRLEVLVGSLLGASLWLKPQLGLLPAALVLAELWVQPRRLARPLYVGLVLGGVAGSASLLGVPDLGDFWAWTIGWGLSSYQAMERSGWMAFVMGYRMVWPAFGAGLLGATLALPRAPASLRSAIGALALGGGVGVALLALQRKGFHYHHTPAIFLFFLGGVLAFQVALFPGTTAVGRGAGTEVGGPSGRERWLAPVLLVAVALAGAGAWGRRVLRGWERMSQRAAMTSRALAGLPEGQPVTVVSQGVQGGPVNTFDLGRPQGTRFTWLGYVIPFYRLPGGDFLRQEPPPSLAAAPPGEAEVLRLLLGDLERSRPAALIFDADDTAWLPFGAETYFLEVGELEAFLRGGYVRDPEAIDDGRYVRWVRRDLVTR